MVKIHGLAYIIIGAVVAFFSYKLDPQKMQLFMYLAILFVIIGIGKLLIDASKKPKKKPVRTHQVHRQPQQQPMQNPHARQQVAHFCHFCGTGVHNFQNFCHNCGQRIFHKR